MATERRENENWHIFSVMSAEEALKSPFIDSPKLADYCKGPVKRLQAKTLSHQNYVITLYTDYMERG